MSLLSNIASISQKDEKWRRKRLGTSSITIGTAGCLLCCATIICRFYGKDTWPDQLNERMKEVGGYYDKNLWIWTKLSEIYPDISHKKTINCFNDPAPLNEIKRRIDEGHPVIVMTFVGDITHYVLLFGYDSKGFYTCDPNRGDVCLFKDRFGDPARYIYKIDFYEGPLREEIDANDELKSKIDSLEKEIKAKNEAIFQLKDRVAELQGIEKDLEGTIEGFKQALKQEKQESANFLNKLAENLNCGLDKATILGCIEEIKSQADRVNLAEGKLVKANDKIKKMEKELAANQDNCQTRLTTKSEEIDGLKTDLARIQKELAKLQAAQETALDNILWRIKWRGYSLTLSKRPRTVNDH